VTAKDLAVGQVSDPLLNWSALVIEGPMPTPDPLPRKLRRDVGGRSFTPGFDGLRKFKFLRRKRRRRGPDPEDGGVPAEPDRPNTLSGGAAAALDFEED
jgi:hypothetical protein